VTRPRREPALQHFAIGRQRVAQDERRHLRARLVVPRKHRRHDLAGAGFGGASHLDAPRAHHLTLPVGKDGGQGVIPARRQGDDVEIGPLQVGHALRIAELLEPGDVVAELGGLLETQLGGEGAHPLFPLPHHVAAAPLEERAEPLDDRGVRARVDAARAGRAAHVDEEEQAFPAAALEPPVAAASQREEPPQRAQHVPHVLDACIGPVVAGAVGAHVAGHLEPRELVGHVDAQEGVLLVGLEHERLGLGRGHHVVEVADPLAQRLQPRIGRLAAEVAAHPRRQELGFSDVEDPAAAVAHDVDAGAPGHQLELLLEAGVPGRRGLGRGLRPGPRLGRGRGLCFAAVGLHAGTMWQKGGRRNAGSDHAPQGCPARGTGAAG
jgi:hypothetical protein